MKNHSYKPGPKNSWICTICEKKIRNAMFMVKDDVWFEAGMKKKNLAHMKCFVEKLGRPLIYQDFNQVQLNDVWTAGMKLPCCFCLFEELRYRYTTGMGLDATYAKLKLAHFDGREYPSNKMEVGKCTCKERNAP